MNAAGALLASGEAGRAALICGADTLTYGALTERVSRAAGSLRARGVAPGERVVLAAGDGMDWVAAHLGAIWAGAVSVLVNPRLDPERLATILRDSGARLLIAERDGAALPTLTPAALVGGRAIDAEPMSPDAPAFWLYSSGTTSDPKAIVHAQRALAGCCAFARDVLAAGPQDRLLASSKLFFAYALANSLYAGLGLGASVILDPEWPAPQRVAQCAVAQRATLLFSVPSLYSAMLADGAGRLRGTTLRYCVSAGEALPPGLPQRWREAAGCGIVGGYGMSETLALVLYRDESQDACARVAPLAEVRADAAVKPGAPVRLWFRHPSQALGYHRRDALERENFRDGWCSAGDLFREPASGCYVFAGRADDWAKVSGRWLSVLELEAQLTRVAGAEVAELAVAVAADGAGLAGVVVFAVTGPRGRAAAQAALDAAVALLPTYQRPRRVHWVDTLPRTATGKLARSGLPELHRHLDEPHRTEGSE